MQVNSRTAALSQLHRQCQPLLWPWTCLPCTALLLTEHSHTRLHHRLIWRTDTAGKIQQNPFPGQIAFTGTGKPWKHTKDIHTHIHYKNTKHNGESFSPLAGKRYSLSIAICITVKLQQIPHLTGLFRNYCYTCILKL